MWITLIVLAALAPESPPEHACGARGTNLQLHSTDQTLSVGEKRVLPLFANRTGARLHFTWRIVERPAGSATAVSNPSGRALAGAVGAVSDPCQYSYFDGSIPNVTPDVPGRFRVEVHGLDLDTGEVAIASAVLIAESKALSPPTQTGCGVSGGHALLAGSLLFLRRRTKGSGTARPSKKGV